MNTKEESANPETKDVNSDTEPNIQENEDLTNDSAGIEQRLSEAYSKNEDLQTKYLRTVAFRKLKEAVDSG